ncbi:unknown [Acidaminococcus sp. CAG:917]|nr:unknown [Acidaminococcus sp. CAG:917]
MENFFDLSCLCIGKTILFLQFAKVEAVSVKLFDKRVVLKEQRVQKRHKKRFDETAVRALSAEVFEGVCVIYVIFQNIEFGVVKMVNSLKLRSRIVFLNDVCCNFFEGKFVTFLTEFEFQERVDNLFDEIDGVFDVKFFARYVIGD